MPAAERQREIMWAIKEAKYGRDRRETAEQNVRIDKKIDAGNNSGGIGEQRRPLGDKRGELCGGRESIR